jgi:hypothetical protein
MHRVPERAQLPRLRLWVARVKVRKECNVIQFPQTRCVISHHVSDSRDVVVCMEDSKVALVQGRQP